ncbi:MAG: 1-acyl-sn-glycerol-3-phosphate acyltransferase [Campylobacterales bacterium]|nr:1-acyl-sn-glycerol-3-phosphate acyltransferase [Campylobacterales bacterium]
MMLKSLFFTFIVKPLIILITGISIKNPQNLPENGQFIIIANHNSHLDIMAIMSLFESKMIKKIRPVAASDYFFKNRILKWISLHLIDIIPLDRSMQRSKQTHPLQNVYDALDKGDSVIIFPEGSRGDPERLGQFKNGIGHLAKKYPNIGIISIVLEETGKCLPKNEALLVPFIIKAEIKEPMKFGDHSLNIHEFVSKLEENFTKG